MSVSPHVFRPNLRVVLSLGILLVIAGAFAAWKISHRDPVPADLELDGVPVSTGAIEAAEPTAPSKPQDEDAENTSTPNRSSPVIASRPVRALDYDATDFAAKYVALAARADAGEVEAVKAILAGLRPCLDAPRTQAEVARLTGLSAESSPGGPSHQSSTQFLLGRMKRCAPLSNEQLGSYKYWLARGAGFGDPAAKIAYVDEGWPTSEVSGANYARDLEQYRTRSRELLAQEIARGNVEALAAASRAYEDRHVYRPDPVLSYAYLHAYALATNRSDSALFDLMAARRAELGEVRLATAIAEGERIFRECCRRK